MQSLNILLVDDDPLVAQSVQVVLESDRHHITSVLTPSEALAKFQKERFDLSLIDYYMPSMRGDALAELLKRQNSHIPLILVSAFPPSPPNPVFDSVLLKPFSAQALRAAVSTALQEKTRSAMESQTGQKSVTGQLPPCDS